MPDLGFCYRRQPSCRTCLYRDADVEEFSICGHPKQRQMGAHGEGDEPMTAWDGICDLHEPRET